MQALQRRSNDKRIEANYAVFFSWLQNFTSPDFHFILIKYFCINSGYLCFPIFILFSFFNPFLIKIISLDYKLIGGPKKSPSGSFSIETGLNLVSPVLVGPFFGPEISSNSIHAFFSFSTGNFSPCPHT